MRPTNHEAAFFMKIILSVLIFLCCTTVFAQTDGYSINVDGSKTYYRIFGNGSPILIINGGPGMNSNGFETLAKDLAVKNQTILYDQRGTGKSKLSKVDASTVNMDVMVADIESLRKQLKIEKWIILGHSFGGMLASYYATKHPNSISKLILSSSGGIDLGLLQYVGDAINSKLTKVQRDSLQYYNSMIARGNVSRANQLGRGRMLAPAYVYNKKFVPLLAERLTQGNSEINQVLWNDMRRIDFDCAPRLVNFRQPVLIIQGKQDIIRPETAEIAHQTFKNSKVVLLDQCGHYGWLDAEARYYDEIAAFLQQ